MPKSTLAAIVGLSAIGGCAILEGVLGGASGTGGGDGSTGSKVGEAIGQLAAQLFPWVHTVAGLLVGVLGDRGQKKARQLLAVRREKKADENAARIAAMSTAPPGPVH